MAGHGFPRGHPHEQRRHVPQFAGRDVGHAGRGATGDSLASLDEAFGLTGDDRSAAIGALRQALDGYEDLPRKVDADDPPETPVVHQANRAVILDDAEIDANFPDRLSSYYDTGTTRVEFSDAEANLDEWAKKHTAGLIKKTTIELVPGIGFVTQDALLFAARWRKPFSSENAPCPSPTAGDPPAISKR